jgi:hypothetical protein
MAHHERRSLPPSPVSSSANLDGLRPLRAGTVSRGNPLSVRTFSYVFHGGLWALAEET